MLELRCRVHLQVETNEVSCSAAAVRIVPAAPADPATKPDALSADMSDPGAPDNGMTHILIQGMM